mmetsp:Transcript_15982/g.43575  ORF Transcript_15982/g.43575 Transcript_15982/m.43575 type:complete len:266 (+) Transcript_15982:2004-2801(+)
MITHDEPRDSSSLGRHGLQEQRRVGYQTRLAQRHLILRERPGRIPSPDLKLLAHVNVVLILAADPSQPPPQVPDGVVKPEPNDVRLQSVHSLHPQRRHLSIVLNFAILVFAVIHVITGFSLDVRERYGRGGSEPLTVQQSSRAGERDKPALPVLVVPVHQPKGHAVRVGVDHLVREVPILHVPDEAHVLIVVEPAERSVVHPEPVGVQIQRLGGGHDEHTVPVGLGHHHSLAVARHAVELLDGLHQLLHVNLELGGHRLCPNVGP